MNKNFFKVAAFYTFTVLSNLEELQKTFINFLKKEDIKGTVLLACEGVNGTVAGTKAGVQNFKNFLKSNDLYNSHNFKTSACADHPFPRLKVKLKNEIVSLGNELADPAKILDGKELAKLAEEDIKISVSKLEKHDITPTLATAVSYTHLTLPTIYSV